MTVDEFTRIINLSGFCCCFLGEDAEDRRSWKLKLQNVGEELLPSESHGDHYYGAVDELCSSPYPPPPPKHCEPSFDRLQIKSQIGLEILISGWDWIFPFFMFTTLNDCVDSRFREFLIRVTGIFRFRYFLKNSNTYPKHRQIHFITVTLPVLRSVH